jgi:hypothetical protein
MYSAVDPVTSAKRMVTSLRSSGMGVLLQLTGSASMPHRLAIGWKYIAAGM